MKNTIDKASKLQIGILTFHHADNLGAVLQAYALQNEINQHASCECEVIDYRNKFVESTRFPHKTSGGIKGELKYLLMHLYYAIKRYNFDSARRKLLKVSRDSYDIDSIKNAGKKYDIFIAGSDQIWNLGCSDKDYTYFLDFCRPDQKYSYAASLGNYSYQKDEQESVYKHLAAFRTISVREESGAEEIRRIGIEKAKVSVHLDPVFLLNEDNWKEIMKKPLMKDKYVFVYLIQEDVHVMSEAVRFAKKNGYRIISNKSSLRFMLNNTPMAFLSWVYHAEAVFTNSFHGTAFSLIFNKPLGADAALKNGGLNFRILNLLSLLGAEQCVLKPNLDSGVEKANAIDQIEVFRRQSKDYIQEIIQR